MPEDKFRITVPVLYSHICDILSVQTISQDLRMALCKVLKRVGIVYGVAEELEWSFLEIFWSCTDVFLEFRSFSGGFLDLY